MLSTRLISIVMALSLAGAADDNLVRNGGFESVSEAGAPAYWIAVGSFGSGQLTDEAPRSGQRAGRIAGDGRQRAWRQTLKNPGTRIYIASGWFRGRDVSKKPHPDGFARFYFHILYKDRPYGETTHLYVDLPTGSYDWRRFALRLTPRTEHPVAQIWVTVAARIESGTLDFDDIQIRPAPFRGGFTALEWAHSGKATVLRDMGKVEPTSALTQRAKRNRWKLVPYEIGNHEGRMIWASDETHAPEVKLPLNARGWHAVFVGIASPSSLARQVLLRLTRDPAFVQRARVAGQVEEVFFKAADLTGQSLHIAQQDDCECRAAGVAYVKLVPLAGDEIAMIKAERADPGLRRLVTSIDGFSFMHGRRPTSRRALLREVEAYRHSDFGTLILQVGGADMVNYASNIGQMRGQDLDDFPRPGDRRYAEAIRILADKRINPTQTLIEGAHDVGMKVHVSIRPGAWVHTAPMEDFFSSKFYRDHPEWRCYDRNGEDVARMSLAVPQVRKHLIDVLREAVSFGADGANVIFVRGVPSVLFEKPFRDLFGEKHGVDPMTLKDDDPRILKLRAEIVTLFLRELRAMLDAEGERLGRRLEQSAYVMGTENDNLRHGLDVATWVREGLIDLVIPFWRVGGAKIRRYDLDFYRRACAAKGVRFTPTFITWRLPALNRVLNDSVKFYDGGAAGVSLWDANSAAARMDRWSVLSRLGHVDELRDRAQEGAPKPVTARFHRLGRFIVDGEYRPNWGF